MLVNGTNPLRQRENLSPDLLCHPDDGSLEPETESATIGRRGTFLSGASEAPRCRAVPSLSLTGEDYGRQRESPTEEELSSGFEALWPLRSNSLPCTMPWDWGPGRLAFVLAHEMTIFSTVVGWYVRGVF